MAYPQTSPILDFTVVDTHNPTTIAIADTSFYPTSFNIINPTIEVTPPGFNTAIQNYAHNTITTFNSNSLQITCVTDVRLLSILPDGIWNVKLSISPPIQWNVERTFIRTEQIKQKLGEAFLKVDLTQCNINAQRENMRVIDEISFFIEASIAAANQCNNILAMNLYRTADTMVNNFLRDRCRGTGNTLWC